MQLPLTLRLKPSRRYFVLLASGHALAGVAVCLLPLPWIFRGGVLLLLGLLLVRTWRSVAQSASSLVLRADGKLDVIATGGSVSEGEVGGETLVLPWLVVLHVADFRPLVIFPDGLSGADDHRQFRLWLKWRVGQKA